MTTFKVKSKVANNISKLFENSDVSNEIKFDRSAGIGGSEVAAILGIDTFKTAYDVWNSKVNNIQQEDSYIMQRGRYMEQFIADKFASEYDVEIYHPNKILQHQKYNFLYGSVDKYFKTKSNEVGILECKDTTKFVDEVVDAHYVQLQWYLMLANLKLGYVAYNTPFDFKAFEVKSNSSFQQYLLNEVVSFWQNYVMTKTPPPAISLNDVKKLYREATEGSTINIDDSTRTVVAELKDIKLQIKKLQSQQEILETQLLNFLGDNETLLDDDTIVATWKNTTTKRFDTKRFQSENPDIYEKYVKLTTSRRLLLK